MVKRITFVATFTTLLAFLCVPAARAQGHWSVHIGIGAPVVPVPVVVAPAPAPPGYIWQPGYYVQTPYGYRRVRGRWVPDPYYTGGPYYGGGYGVYWDRERWRGEHDDGDWDDDHEWRGHREHEWREHREHEWRERHGSGGYYRIPPGQAKKLGLRGCPPGLAKQGRCW